MLRLPLLLLALVGLLVPAHGTTLLTDPKILAVAGTEVFGSSVSISGELLAVGASGESSQRAFVFSCQPTCSLLQELPNVLNSVGFGYAVSVSAGRVAVGDFDQEPSGLPAVTIFDCDKSACTFATSVSSGVPGDLFGATLALSGELLAVGAIYSNGATGEVQVFHCPPGAACSLIERLTPSDGLTGDLFGASIALDGSRLVVGAIGKDGTQGGAYLFDCTLSACTPVETLSPPFPSGSDFFGVSASISGPQVLVGASLANGGLGGAFLFNCSSSPCSLAATLTGEFDGENLGTSVSIAGNKVVLGASEFQMGTGRAVVYECEDAGCTLLESLSSGLPDGYFGLSVSTSPSLVAIGAYGDLGSQGQVYVSSYYQDPCAPSPCNTGTCSNVLGSAVCDCAGTGFTGPTCSEDLCSPNPCAHGTCSGLTGSAVCNCTGTGFTGPTCSEDLCSPNPCAHGTCSGLTGTAVCACDGTGFSGPTCSDDVDECSTGADNCTPTQICNNTIGGFTCEDPCSPNPCNGGACSSPGGVVSCDCAATGLAGPFCDSELIIVNVTTSSKAGSETNAAISITFIGSLGESGPFPLKTGFAAGSINVIQVFNSVPFGELYAIRLENSNDKDAWIMSTAVVTYQAKNYLFGMNISVRSSFVFEAPIKAVAKTRNTKTAATTGSVYVTLTDVSGDSQSVRLMPSFARNSQVEIFLPFQNIGALASVAAGSFSTDDWGCEYLTLTKRGVTSKFVTSASISRANSPLLLTKTA